MNVGPGPFVWVAAVDLDLGSAVVVAVGLQNRDTRLFANEPLALVVWAAADDAAVVVSAAVAAAGVVVAVLAIVVAVVVLGDAFAEMDPRATSFYDQ